MKEREEMRVEEEEEEEGGEVEEEAGLAVCVAGRR